MDGYQQARMQQFSHFLSIFPARIARLQWSRDQILLWQQTELRRTLAYAKSHSSWYSRRLAGIDPEKITVSDLDSIPPMTKKDLMENWDDIVTVDGVTLGDVQRFVETLTDHQFYNGSHHAISSGGTSGQASVILYDHQSLAEHAAGFLRSYLPEIFRITNSLRPRAVAVGSTKAQHISVALSQIFSNPENPTHILPIIGSTDQLIERLEALDPEVIQSSPSALSILLNRAEAGTLHISPKVITSSSEPLNDGLRSRIETAWGAKIFDFWSSSEASGTFPCLTSSGFHVSEDINIMEGISDSGGKSRGVLLTNLYNKCLPLIRYHMDDIVEFDDKICSCGIKYKKINRVGGRIDNIFWYDKGVFVHPIVYETTLLSHKRIDNYQVSRIDRGIGVKLVCSEIIDIDSLKERLIEDLLRAGIEDPIVQIEIVEGLERLPSGKLLRAVTEIKARSHPEDAW